jgi:hypothetical protein
MRRPWISLLLLLLLLLACRSTAPGGPVLEPTPEPTQIPTPPPSPLPSPTLSPTAAPAAEEFEVRLHPDGPLYIGDWVSFEVIAPQGMELEGAQVRIQTPEGRYLAPADFGSFGIGRRTQATLYWGWHTLDLEPGEHTLTFSISPSGPEWTETVSLLPAEQHPYPESRWAVAESDCCLFYYVTGTDAERDLEQILSMADEQAASVSSWMNASFTEPIPVVLLPRVLGHGGFASSEISISYLDRNYAGSSPELVLHHEMVHILDGRLGGELRPSLFVEGLAVYLTGGHFKPEPLLPRAAALVPPEPGCTPPEIEVDLAGAEVCGLGEYVPLTSLFDSFYFAQHEIGYLQAAALVEYMVESWGYEAFEAFYRSILPVDSGLHSEAADAALQRSFGITLAELEARFLERLQAERLTPALVLDVAYTVEFYDTVRSYQQALDPSAYFLTAWLPGTSIMRERGIVADYLRHPDAPENQALEILLVGADQALRQGDFAYTRQLLQTVQSALEAWHDPAANENDAVQ